MKKLFITLAALMMVLAACSSTSSSKVEESKSEEVVEEGTGVYQVYNTTGEKLSDLYLYVAGSEDKGTNYAEGGMKNNRKVELTYTGPSDSTLVLEFTTASGVTKSFETLHVEEAPIALLSDDAMTGATVISFGEPQGTGVYKVYNTTGEKLTDLYLYPNGSEDKGTNYADGGMKNNKSVELTYTGVVDSSLTLEFTTESGVTKSFETLHIEEAPIALLSDDAMTGATVISFGEPQGTGTYTIYNTTGATVTELYLYAAGSEDKGENLAGEGLADKESVELTYTGAVDSTLTLEFVTEEEGTKAFETLHIEEAPISLLSNDAMTGATVIKFAKPE